MQEAVVVGKICALGSARPNINDSKLLQAMLHDYTYTVASRCWATSGELGSAPKDSDTNKDFACLGHRDCSITSMIMSGSIEKLIGTGKQSSWAPYSYRFGLFPPISEVMNLCTDILV